jgi:WD40 repeat protein
VHFNNISGMTLLTAARNSSNRLWDVRKGKCIKNFKGHQNSSKNFIRAAFGPRSTVVGGSEDGAVYVWDVVSTSIMQRLAKHRGIVFDVKWNSRCSLLARYVMVDSYVV